MVKVPVSVIIPCFNCQNTIMRAVKSVFMQILKPLEVILVNDCSTDQTIDVLKDIKKRYGEDWIKIIDLEKNKGPSYARNIGWELAKGDYVAFLDADDSWYPEKIKLQYTLMKKNPSIYISGHLIDYPSKKNKSFDNEILTISLSKALIKNYFITPSVMVKRKIPERFDVNQRHSEDYLLWLTILNKYGKGRVINKYMGELYKHPYGESGLSGNLWLMEKGELTTYKKMFPKIKGIKKFVLIPVMLISLMKFVRRLLKVYF